MPTSPQGQPVTVSTEIRLAPVPPATTGVLTNPGTILLRLKKPDGTFQADYASPVNDATGKFHVDIPGADLNTLGLYRWAWFTTGTASGATPRAGIINVVDPFAPAHISFEDAKARLNIPAAYDSEIQAFIDSAIAEQEQRVGAVAPRTVTELVWARYGRLDLSTRPVLSVVSATVSGSPVTTSDWTVPSAMAGLVELGTGAWWGGSGPAFSGQQYAVTYTAGRNPVPQDLVEAALLRVQSAYDTQRGPAGMPLAVDQDSGFGSSYPLLLRAQDKERPYVLPSVA